MQYNSPSHLTDCTYAKSDSIGFSPRRIVIVGAGLAGLNCASQLGKQGIRAQVYEASDRVGGRVFTASGLEMGGEFIDSNHADILRLIREFNLPLYDVKSAAKISHEEVYFFEGKRYSVADAVKAFQPYSDQISAHSRLLPANLTFGQKNEVECYFDQLSIADYFDLIGMKSWIRSLLEIAYVTEYGREVDDQSAINFLSLSPHINDGRLAIFGKSDERYKIVGGNQRLVDNLYRRLPGQVSLGHKLTEISQIGSEYQLVFELPNGACTTVVADYVVVTIPFTVLRNVRLDLPLPAWKRDAIQGLGYGTHSKLFLGFDGQSEGIQRSLFSDQALQSGWSSGGLPSATQSAYTVYLGGQASLCASSSPLASQAEPFLGVLGCVSPDVQAAFNGRVEGVHWARVPSSLGSYSCYQVGQYTTIAGAEGRRVGNLFFAGEHCSPKYQGFMNGAAETGRRVANELVAVLQKLNN